MASVVIRQSDLNDILVELRRKVEGVKSLRTPYNREQIAKAAFTIAGSEFIRQTNLLARGGDESLKHVYEWKKAGVKTARLFVLERTTVSGGFMTITSKFLKSRTFVPIHPQLKKAGRNGKSVTAKHVFREKASVMEAGKPVRIMAKAAKAIAIPGRDGTPVFIRKPYYITVKNPGGVAAKGGFNKHMRTWFRNPVNVNLAIARTGFFNALERSIARELRIRGAGKERASMAIKSVSDRYSKGLRVL